ncbi:probable protein phosphatase 2C 8 [Carya illinoinensis]|uniref:protein-serine/threonine phosphatase n=1 Tax=Carya illinoinensis TaxID=32201 RepID=A0A8T1QMD4_CARIL|nr:probable protein phosphatase 2C 8 [Carya illinoinensis]KAG6655988.1 hypothetical protein CIPAW_05G255400 [Carya illinoinensis]
MALDSEELSQLTLTKTKNTRRKRLKVRRLKYTYRTKIHVERQKGKQLLDENKEDYHHTVEKKISLSLTSSYENDEILSFWRESPESFTTYGSVSLIGRRREMEDAVRVELGFMKKSKIAVKYDFFGVYDGHGGPQVATACEERLHGVLVEESDDHVQGHEDEGMDYWQRVMEACFAKMDEEVRDNGLGRTVGSTAVVAVVGEEVVVVANCGDCRAVMCSGGVALALSTDHKPGRPDELNRIESAGGRVVNWNGQRVLGVLATSRSIGDHYLRPYVISKPEVTITKRMDKDEFLILASDGLWDVIPNELACRIVKRCLDGKMRSYMQEVENESRPAEAAALLAELALARGSKDNISVIVVELRKSRGFVGS